MSDPTQIDPAAGAPPAANQTPSTALRALAARLEAGDPPPIDEIGAALGSFRAAGLPKSTKQVVIEAREDVKAGRLPDALGLRMIAKALEAAAPPPSSAAVAPARPPRPPIKKAPGLKDVAIGAAAPAAAEPAAAPAAVSGWWPPVPEQLDAADHAREAASEIRDLQGSGCQTWHGYTEDDAVATMSAFERLYPPRPHVPTLPPIDDAPTADERTDAEWVAIAADVIEHLDMPRHAELVGTLYEIASKLEDQRDAAPDLLDRAERAIRKRVEVALNVGGDLPAWVLEWAARERARRDNDIG